MSTDDGKATGPEMVDQLFGTDQEKMVRVDPRATAVYDDEVVISIDRFVAWMKPVRAYSSMSVGPTCSPMGTLLVKIPVKGAVAGQPLTPAQFAEVMLVTAKMVGPAAMSFAALVEDEFGLRPPDPTDESDF